MLVEISDHGCAQTKDIVVVRHIVALLLSLRCVLRVVGHVLELSLLRGSACSCKLRSARLGCDILRCEEAVSVLVSLYPARIALPLRLGSFSACEILLIQRVRLARDIGTTCALIRFDSPLALVYVLQNHVVVCFSVERHIAIQALRLFCDVIELLRDEERLHLGERSADFLGNHLNEAVVGERADANSGILDGDIVRTVLDESCLRLFRYGVRRENVLVLAHDLYHVCGLLDSQLQLILSERDIVAENEAALVVGDMVGKLQAEASVADLARESCGLSFGSIVLEVALRELVEELFVGLVVLPCRLREFRNALIVLGSTLEEGQNLLFESRLCFYELFEGVAVGENLLCEVGVGLVHRKLQL